MKKKLILFIFFGITLSLKGQINLQHTGTLKELWTVLNKNYGYNFMYSNEEINDREIISIHLSDVNIQKLFDELKDKINIEYEIKNKTVILKKKKEVSLVKKQKEAEIKKEDLLEAYTIEEKIKWEKLESDIPFISIIERNIDAILQKPILERGYANLKERQHADKDKPEKEERILSQKNKSQWGLSIQSNLLYDVVLIPNLGMELKINERLGILVTGAWTHINWNNGNRKYRLWSANAEIRYYFFDKRNFYVGGLYQMGEINYKFSDKGKQGDFLSGGITTGYILNLNQHLKLDLGIGFGYNYFDYESYQLIDGVNIREDKGTDKMWFPCKMATTLIWQIK